MRITQICILILLSLNFACTQNHKEENKIKSKKVENIKVDLYDAHTIDSFKIDSPVIPASTILADFKSFWNYYTRYIELYKDFIAFDTKGKIITKESFLKQLNSGLYFPLLIDSKTNAIHYKLFKMPHGADESISVYMKQFSRDQLVFYKMEGRKIPHFNFLDVNGKNYTSENTKGKIIVFKCWFIHCLSCVQEMPDLNKLVEKYKNRKDILFISLAIDSKKELQEFLGKTKFDYAVVPNQEDYMTNKLHVSAYPTHFLIDKSGKLVHVFPDAVKIAEALEKEAVE